MNANEAPEKIYVHVKNDKVTNIWNSTFIGVRDIEYTRTDAFIEKAAKFLDDNLYTDANSSGRGLWTEVIADMGFDTVEEFIEDFRNYMNGE